FLFLLSLLSIPAYGQSALDDHELKDPVMVQLVDETVPISNWPPLTSGSYESNMQLQLLKFFSQVMSVHVIPANIPLNKINITLNPVTPSMTVVRTRNSAL